MYTVFQNYIVHMYVHIFIQIEDDFRENAERTLNETATNNRTDYLNDWNDVQIDVCKA